MQKILVYNILSNKARFIRSTWRSQIRLRAKRARAKETPKQTQLLVDFKPNWTVITVQWPQLNYLINTKINMDKLQVNGSPSKDMAWLEEMVLEWIRRDLVMWNRLRWLKSPCELKVMSALSRVIIGSLYLFKMWTMWLTCLVSRYSGKPITVDYHTIFGNRSTMFIKSNRVWCILLASLFSFV